ncbi:hypothetical protein DT23_18085 [Thioclava indica]|uniref:Uncharacterized protein n=1 Tax=Thioclava indica TaxID=1353528 RepID=A0A074JB88_9RHOB|nr:hypothetical protein DT23_18085 [Thioclava indica]
MRTRCEASVFAKFCQEPVITFTEFVEPIATPGPTLSRLHVHERRRPDARALAQMRVAGNLSENEGNTTFLDRAPPLKKGGIRKILNRRSGCAEANDPILKTDDFEDAARFSHAHILQCDQGKIGLIERAQGRILSDVPSQFLKIRASAPERAQVRNPFEVGLHGAGGSRGSHGGSVILGTEEVVGWMLLVFVRVVNV